MSDHPSHGQLLAAPAASAAGIASAVSAAVSQECSNELSLPVEAANEIFFANAVTSSAEPPDPAPEHKSAEALPPWDAFSQANLPEDYRGNIDYHVSKILRRLPPSDVLQQLPFVLSDVLNPSDAGQESLARRSFCKAILPVFSPGCENFDDTAPEPQLEPRLLLQLAAELRQATEAIAVEIASTPSWPTRGSLAGPTKTPTACWCTR